MASTHESKTISISINRSPREVYDFAANPGNLSKWASGIGASVAHIGGEWVAQSPQGPVKIRFAQRNDFGVLDHYVTPSSGAEVYVPMRVVANGSGSELVFTLFRLPGMSEQQFKDDAEWVMRDLAALKKLLEAG